MIYLLSYISVNLFETSGVVCHITMRYSCMYVYIDIYIYVFVKPFGTSALVCHTKCYYIYIYVRIYVKPFGTSALLCRIPVAYRVWWVNPRCLRSIPVSVGGDACACLLVEYHIYTVALLASNPQRNGDHPANIVS